MTPTHKPATVLNCLRAVADGPADAALLTRFSHDRDEAAFELLVWRHAGMVLAVCRAVLRDHHAAEDACQATFLALARQAHAVGGRGTAAGWLYRVARRTAVRAARRRGVRAVDAVLDHLPAPAAGGEPDADAVAALHDELDRLPEKYRTPVLLCFLEGLTYADAARRLGWPVGTVAGRVARAKDRLRARLTGRGVAVPAAGAVALVGAVNVVRPAFAAATTQAAATFAAGGVPAVSGPVLELAKGAVRTMIVSKLQWAAAALVAVTALAAGGVWAGGQPPGAGGSAGAPPAAAAQPVAPPPAADRTATASQRRRSLNNLKQILLAVHNYESTYGHLPSDIRDPSGKALLSWRVALLPYLEQDNLYRQFKLTEPWDSEHNLKLLDKMPPSYRVGFEPAGATHTFYQAFAGPGTPFGPQRPGDPPGAGGGASGPSAGLQPPAGTGVGPRGSRPLRMADVTDGTSNTFGVVEVGPAVAWTKPTDVAYSRKGPLPKLAWPFTNGFHVGMMDGAAFAVRPGLSEADLRKLIEIDDGQPSPDLRKLRPATPADTPEERAMLRDQVARNRTKLVEVERLMKEHVELLGVELGKAADSGTAEEHGAGLDHIIDELRQRNRSLRGQKGEPPPPPPGPAPKR
ncbi:sigma-70 family RNA polymerase sigma factor [Urbifossiella limnaea]|uniref:ECF RNA polymerase sigma factor SigE n=1 Tax=Urbifossiella limnaea TaxID=2528023 RepID=A0A517XZI1_9BACT|nr:sigma-70 family RNA polymerase sigma factor [Urbifossiella limnaea]QDU22917.1 ECF RNA polymerase sigma factor SigE [Urbifossiella limnaea]